MNFYDYCQQYLKIPQSPHLPRYYAIDFGDTNINKKEHMTKFNKGDIVKRDDQVLAPSLKAAGVRIGNKYEVVSDDGYNLSVVGVKPTMNRGCFTLVKAAKPPFKPVRAKDLKVGDWIRMPKAQETRRNNADMLEADTPYRVTSVQIGTRFAAPGTRFAGDSVNVDCASGGDSSLNLAEGYTLDHMEKCDAPVGYREKPVRVVTAHEVECASGDGSTLTINYDPNGSGKGGPCVDFDITDSSNDIVEIEDLPVLDRLIDKLKEVRRDFVRDTSF